MGREQICNAGLQAESPSRWQSNESGFNYKYPAGDYFGETFLVGGGGQLIMIKGKR